MNSSSNHTEPEQDEKQKSFPLVGIAASAGGLEAFTQLLQHLPTDTGMAFVLIQHLNPDQKSSLREILARTTQMPVREVVSGMTVEPNQVYIIPPNTQMTLVQGVLQLAPREKINGRYMPGDTFFASLAAERGSLAFGVVLSGTDGDGALGVEAIKVAGGVTFAQCEGSAKFDSMPTTAVATGRVDFILPPKEIALELAKIGRHPYVTSLKATVDEPVEDEDALLAIFASLRTATKVDFTHYKRTTVNRRLGRRMLLYKLERLADYACYLWDNPAEVKALYQELLISVTSFFRDPEAFEVLQQRVFPAIAPGKSGLPIRIWVPGCATGEEIYSIAICLLEFLERMALHSPFQIFATDISETAIETARAGIYKQNQMEGVSAERRRRFFVQVEGGYQICKAIRERCVFARQNLLSDPPFCNLDLISCRNVLIYLGPTLQQQVFSVFHYSLKPTGFLFLGTSESAGDANLFTLVDKKSKLYSRKPAPIRPNFDFVTSNHPITNVNDAHVEETTFSEVDPEKEADRIVLNQYAPSGVLTNNEMDILQFRGDTSPYLRPAPGKASFNLLKMARSGLLPELRTAMHQARRQDTSVRKSGLRVEGSDPPREVSVEVIPFKASPAGARYFLVLFEDTPPVADLSAPDAHSGKAKPRRKQTESETEISRLQLELAGIQEYLQVTIQEQEITHQELRVANEEILSSNEELQSTNEELETAKEEIQATNEELSTTNEELRSRIQESNQINSDLRNLLSSVNIPIVMLGNDLCIRRFTPMAEKIFNLLSTDVGRPFGHIKPNINIPNLEQLIEDVIDTLVIKEQEVQDNAGRWYDLRIRPYKTTENQIDGVVLVLVDIDVFKRSTEQLKESRDYAEAIVETIRQPLIVLDADLKVTKANRSFYEMFQVSPAQTEHRSIFELGNGQWNIPQLRSLLEEVLPENNEVYNFEVEHVFENIGRKTMLLNACRIVQAGNKNTVLLAIEDITARKLFEQQRSQVLAQEQSARYSAEADNRAKDEFLSIVSHELRNPLNSMLGWTHLLRTRRLNAAKTEQALEMIERSARLQTKLIEELLDISRISTGKLQLNFSVIALADVIHLAINVVRPSADAKNIQIESLEPETISVSGDPDRLQQVLWNLLSNAIKFTPAGGRVTVKLERAGSSAQIQVSDTGIGISADFLPYVFERFRQADSSSTRTQGGLGLGLAIVRQLVELHGGTVHAESPGQGQGTTMTVRLPLRVPTDSLPTNLEQVSTKLSVPVDSSQPLAGLRVLVVDDEAGMRELLKTIVEQYGAEVTAVDSAKEAIAVLTGNPGQHDVLLSDIGMPNEDGYALIRQVRALSDQSREIPAAALTAYVRVEEQSETLAAGFQRHISKPVEPAQLVAIIADLAGGN